MGANFLRGMSRRIQVGTIKLLTVPFYLIAITHPSIPSLFPEQLAGQPIKQIKTFWKTVLKEAKLMGVRIYDLHHIFLEVLKSNREAN